MQYSLGVNYPNSVHFSLFSKQCLSNFLTPTGSCTHEWCHVVLHWVKIYISVCMAINIKLIIIRKLQYLGENIRTRRISLQQTLHHISMLFQCSKM